MSNAVPSLSTSGFVVNIAEKADKVAAYYFASDFSQTTLFRGSITSLAYQIQQNGNDPLKLRSVVESEVSAYFSRYFDTVAVNVSTDIPRKEDPHRINLTVDVLVTEAGYQYSLGRLIQTHQGAVLKIIDINNNG